MSGYRDPYITTDNSHAGYMRNNSYNQSDEYNPYMNAPPPPTNNNFNNGPRTGTLRRRESSYDRELPPAPSTQPLGDPGPGFGDESFGKLESRNSFTPLMGPRNSISKKDLKSWRKEMHSEMWTRGSRGRCIGRFCCCTLLIAVLLIVSIVLALALWVRPPQVLFTGVQPTTSGSTFEATTNNEFKVNLGFGLFVNNPNYFDASFSSIEATITYPLNGNNVNVGGGTADDVTFKSHSQRNFTFPFSFVYDKTADPNETLINDLVNKCGFIDPSTKTDLTINYELNLKLKIAFLKVGPSFGGSTNFACPVTAAEIKPFLAGLGITIPGLN